MVIFALVEDFRKRVSDLLCFLPLGIFLGFFGTMVLAWIPMFIHWCIKRESREYYDGWFFGDYGFNRRAKLIFGMAIVFWTVLFASHILSFKQH